MKKKNIFAIVIIFIITTILFASVSYIEAMSGEGWNDFNQAKANKENDVTNWGFSMNQVIPEEVTNVIGTIIAYLRNISIMITVVVITILGIKYMIGSVEQKADYKKDYINIIIGTVLITMVFSIVSFIFTIAENI